MIKTIIEDGKVKVESPYNLKFVEYARRMKGKFDRSTKRWEFKEDDLEVVKQRLIDVYGEDGISVVTKVVVDICLMEAEWLNESSEASQFIAFGRTLATRSSRDREVFIGDDDVILKAGNFPKKGGSSKYPSLDYDEEVVMRVKNIPLSLYEKVTKKSSDGLTIVKEQEYDKDALLNEKSILLKRINEIDNLLKAQ
ncbi:hypothetical protein CW357_00780 [Rummeliibacillus sp. TYF005]|uniref:hypothetical protein n=1 Tax=Rummeliibacillus sp. TYF005 TaxID=2058214 RepID=UPI000F543FEB|nr:hypothetical protein [Rummeliibacillus sp. TYF005]RPJ97237.1 hypothetical protein CW357_00780 [Rummeliibacillus sp. TYF005]